MIPSHGRWTAMVEGTWKSTNINNQQHGQHTGTRKLEYCTRCENQLRQEACEIDFALDQASTIGVIDRPSLSLSLIVHVHTLIWRESELKAEGRDHACGLYLDQQ